MLKRFPRWNQFQTPARSLLFFRSGCTFKMTFRAIIGCSLLVDCVGCDFFVCFESGIWQSILFHTRDRLARAFQSWRAGRDLCAGKITRGKVARSAGALLILGRFFVVVCCVEGKHVLGS